MSAQVKKRFEELATYFKRDPLAMERLKHLKDDVNVLRHALAAAEQREQQAVNLKDAARRRADEADQRAEEAEAAAAHLADKVKALEYRVVQLTSKEQQPDCDDAPEWQVAGSDGEVTAVAKALRKRLPHLPAPIRRVEDASREGRVYSRESISQGWSHSSLWVLGATVAMVVFLMGEVLIVDDDSSEKRREKRMPDDISGWKTAMLKWVLKNNIAIDPKEWERENYICGIHRELYPFLRK